MQPSIPASALDALGLRLQGEAHNVANVNTTGFRPGGLRLEEAAGGRGVSAVVTASGDRLFPPQPEDDARGAVLGRLDGGQAEERLDDDLTDRAEGERETARLLRGQRQAASLAQAAESAADLVRELVAMVGDQRAFEANARVVQVMERMGGYVLDGLA